MHLFAVEHLPSSEMILTPSAVFAVPKAAVTSTALRLQVNIKYPRANFRLSKSKLALSFHVFTKVFLTNHHWKNARCCAPIITRAKVLWFSMAKVVIRLADSLQI